MAPAAAAPSDPPPTPTRPDTAVATLLHPSLTRVLVAVRDLALHQEVLDFLGRDGRVDVVGATTGPAEIARIVERSDVEAVVCCPELARAASRISFTRVDDHLDRVPDLLVVAGELTVPVLRLAVDVGARGAYRWPEEREDLVDRVRSGGSRRPSMRSGRGRVIAVVPARGGAGGTFVSTQLAVSLASRSVSTALVDGALSFSDLTPALGFSGESPSATIADLRPVARELDPQHLAHVLRRHDAGFDALLAPTESQAVDGDGPGLVRMVLKVLAAEFDAVVVHLARGLDEVGLAAAGLADVCLLVTTLDVFSLYGAKRLIGRLTTPSDSEGVASRIRVVVNRAARGGPTDEDVWRILAVSPMGRVRNDPAVPKAQAYGELFPPRSAKAPRDVDALTETLVGELGIARRVSAPS